MHKKTNISIIGAGAMGGAIARAVASDKTYAKSWQLTVVDRTEEKLLALKKTYRSVKVSSEYSSLADADVIVLAVKPQSFDELAACIADIVPKRALVISIMAGRSIKNIRTLLQADRVVHAMPNLGAQFSESMTVWCGEGLTPANKKFAHDFFDLLGAQIYTKDEDVVNKATAVTGSGIGFFAWMIEAYIEAACTLGLSAKEAELAVLETLKATNTILQKKVQTPGELRKAVTSKGGTTEAGLSVLMGKQFSALLEKTLAKAYARAQELSS